MVLTVLHEQNSIFTSPRRSESRNVRGGSPAHACRAKSFPLAFLKAYKGSFASVNKIKTQITKKSHVLMRKSSVNIACTCIYELEKEKRTWNATSFEAIPTTTSDGTRRVCSVVFLEVGNDSGNPLDFEHHFSEGEVEDEEKVIL